MKKLLLVFLALMTLSTKAQTWLYHPFLDSNAIWNVTLQDYLYEEDFSYALSGDTLINGFYYHKISKPFINIVGVSGTQYNYAGYAGSIRQDTTNRKIYFIFSTDNIEYLLYDFNLQVGDTLKGYSQFFCPSFIKTIISTDSILIGSSYRKRWNTNQNFSIIEGIGSTLGLLDFCFYSLSPTNILTCFQQNGQSLFPSTTTNCELITSVNSGENILFQINVFPNPFTNKTTLQFDNSKKENFTLTIYNLQGQVVLTIANITNDNIEIERQNLMSGLYFFHLRTDKRVTSGKLMVN